ncbi:MAG TPA: zinc-ribbon domain-containing protein [Candidatus Bathyarchaeia archaeon]|nr:zinc-ribbon domain-containing protein [Candidatus Bathyarchaeia archaeon]
MVLCTKCGRQNQEGARFCTNCGTDLYYRERREKREKEENDCFGTHRREGDECFGLPHGGAIVGIIFGVFLLIVGIAELYGLNLLQNFWAFGLIILGILIVVGTIYSRSRR